MPIVALAEVSNCSEQQPGVYRAFSYLGQANLRGIVHFQARAGFVWFFPSLLTFS